MRVFWRRHDETARADGGVPKSGNLLWLGLFIVLAQALFWGLYASPLSPRAALNRIDRIPFSRVELAELKAPTTDAADAAVHEKANLPFTACCDPAYLSLRLKFDLDNPPADGLGLVAFQQVDNFIIRVNGSVVHQLGAMEFGQQTFHGQRPYLVRLPSGLLKAGENELSFITVRHGYPYSDLIEPLMGPYDQVREATAMRFWQAIEYRLLAGWLTFVLGLFALVMVFRSSDRRFALWLTLLCWSWTAFAAYGLFFDLPFGGIGRMVAFFAVNSLVAASLLGFIDAWTKRPLPWGQEAVAGIWLVFNGLVLISLSRMSMPEGFDMVEGAWTWFSLICGVLVVARLIWHFATVQENRHIEAALLSICAVCMALDGVGERFGLLAGGFLIDSAPLLLLAFVAAFLQRNFTLFHSAMELNGLLETNLKAREAELVEVHARERELVGRQARSEERRRLMRDMHDGVGGQLVGLLLAVRRGGVDNDRVAEGLQSAMDEIRLMIDSVDARGTSLNAMLGVFETRIGPRIEAAGLGFEWRREISDAADLSPQDVLQVFRVMQEVTTNALKHSGGDRISVSVTDATPGELTVTIADNGKGMTDQTGHARGHGLQNIVDRAEALGGQLAFHNGEPGLTVTLSVPLRQTAVTDACQAA